MPKTRITQWWKIDNLLFRGLANEELYVQLFVQDHTELEACFFVAQRLTDNYKHFNSQGDNASISSRSTRREDDNHPAAIAEKVARILKLNHPNMGPELTIIHRH